MPFPTCSQWIPLLALLLAPFAASADERPVTISDGLREKDGTIKHTVTSPWQAGTTEIRVLTPSRLEAGRRYPVVYLLPVEANRETRYGDGMTEVQKLGLADKSGAVFVAPTFSHLPWYADHPQDPEIRQESYFLNVVLPAVEERYPVSATARDRLLLGYSKSGWGAWSLLLRHPDLFGRAAAWDAPLNKEQPDQFGMQGIFATEENFRKYHVSRLLAQQAGELRKSSRLILLGYGGFRQHHQEIEALLNELEIPHIYRDGPLRKHDWHSGWVTEAAELLLKD